MATPRTLAFLGICIIMAITFHNQVAAAKTNCTSTIGAVEFDDKIYLFFEDRVEHYNSVTRRRIITSDISEFTDKFEGRRVDTVFTLSQYPKSIFVFTQDLYYQLSQSMAIVEIGNIKDFIPVNKRFQQGGIDAVAEVQGQIYIFKGCEVIKKISSVKRNVIPTNHMGLPCSVDAVFVDNDTIIAMKGPLMWKLVPTVRGMRAKPYCFNCEQTTQ